MDNRIPPSNRQRRKNKRRHRPKGKKCHSNTLYEQTGARNLLVGSIELARDLPRNFAVATFFDIGNAIQRFGDPLAYSVGVGLRFRLPVITLGFDVAKPLYEPGSDGGHGLRVHLNISPKL